MFVQAFKLILFSFSRDLIYQSFANGINCLTKTYRQLYITILLLYKPTLKIMDFKISLMKTFSSFQYYSMISQQCILY